MLNGRVYGEASSSACLNVNGNQENPPAVLNPSLPHPASSAQMALPYYAPGSSYYAPNVTPSPFPSLAYSIPIENTITGMPQTMPVPSTSPVTANTGGYFFPMPGPAVAAVPLRPNFSAPASFAPIPYAHNLVPAPSLANTILPPANYSVPQQHAAPTFPAMSVQPPPVTIEAPANYMNYDGQIPATHFPPAADPTSTSILNRTMAPSVSDSKLSQSVPPFPVPILPNSASRDQFEGMCVTDFVVKVYL